MKLHEMIFSIVTEIDLTALFSSDNFKSTKIDKGYKLVFDCKDIEISDDLKEVFENSLHVEAVLSAFSIVHNKKFKIADREDIVINDYGGRTRIGYGRDFSGEDYIDPSEWKDKDGNIFYKKESAAKDIVNFANDIEVLFGKEYVLRYVIEKFNDGYFDQEKEFYYLYDIKEAIKCFFDDRNKDFITELNLSNKDFSNFGHIINNQPIFQSRHPGKFAKHLLPASGDTTRELRSTARKLILKFIAYLLKEHGLQEYT